ncbi:glycerol-3-phosphate acyltransferase [Caldicellulosiruptor morganii]|uniref:Glycerol-3-phosphate acyltransferase n=1 Tax=Caldicellulosiruptor morganii TaxID=1387555 RepID=A0ABY7BLL0_9FIRM|nr:glycerol-3-phosphate acyltransferase [Caldicellulosiruptor morganii]WAM33464.1 glycerol-3-phosphate acyltransferase [Caldicellulosiruptor morganii]
MVFALISFLIGSIPFSYIITKKFFNKDITDSPDRNPGATNAFRIAGVKAGVPSLILDISKGYFVAYIAKYVLFLKGPNLYLVVFMVILGHAYSVFLHFQGGKSIAATTGVLFAFWGIFPVVFFCTFYIFRPFDVQERQSWNSGWNLVTHDLGKMRVLAS